MPGSKNSARTYNNLVAPKLLSAGCFTRLGGGRVINRKLTACPRAHVVVFPLPFLPLLSTLRNSLPDSNHLPGCKAILCYQLAWNIIWYITRVQNAKQVTTASWTHKGFDPAFRDFIAMIQLGIWSFLFRKQDPNCWNSPGMVLIFETIVTHYAGARDNK